MLGLLKRHMFMGVAGLALIGMVAWAGLRAVSSDSAAGGPRGAAQGGGGPGAGGGQAAPVTLHTVGTVPFIQAVEAIGTARANESVTISAKVTDIVSKLNFESGQYVRRGEVLVELASVEQGADVREAQAALTDAERELARIEDLVSRGVAPRVRADDARTVRDRARERVAALQARMADRVIRAPFAGYVGLRTTSAGQLARPGEVIATLDDVSVIKLDVDLAERYLSRITLGQTLTARAAAFPDIQFTGRISEIDSRVDPVTRTVRVRAEIPNRDNHLRPGMLLEAQVQEEVREVLAIPEISLLRRDDTAFVYVVSEGERGLTADRRTVTPGERRNGMVEILEGLAAGDRVVEDGIIRMRPGIPVRLAGDAPVLAGQPARG
jgi:membrane fusion protein (multidrug efflux system)